MMYYLFFAFHGSLFKGAIEVKEDLRALFEAYYAFFFKIVLSMGDQVLMTIT